MRSRIERPDDRRVAGRLDKRRRGPKAARLENLRHVGNRQPLRKSHVDDVHIAPSELADDIDRRHRLVESIFARLEVPGLPAHPQRDAVGELIADHAGRDQPIADRFRTDTLGNLDELFRSDIAAIRFPSAQVPDGGRGHGADEGEEDEDRETFHDTEQV